MKKKIYISIALLSSLVALMITSFLLVSFYNFHVDNEIKALKDYGRLVADILDNLDQEPVEYLKGNTSSNIRLTLINNEGKVLFDNMADSESMDNHMDREEIRSAIEFGEGQELRKSATLNENTYYYAVRLSNNSILRISRQGAWIFSHFTNILPLVFAILVIILLLSLATSSIMTRKILKPVKEAASNIKDIKDKDKSEALSIYKELDPFLEELKRQNEEISSSKEEIEEKALIMDEITFSMNEGLILIDKDKKILSANISGVELLEGDESISYHGRDLLALTRDRKLYESIDQAIESKSNEELALSLGSKYINVYINPVLSKGRLIGLIILLVDFTEKHRLDMMRREFSSNVSHELKTPLTSINGYAEIIENGLAKEGDIKKFAATIREEGVRLLNLIDSIIKLSKIEEGEVSKDFNQVDLYQIAKETIESLSFIAYEKDISLALKGFKVNVRGNKAMLGELIYNLVENGIKYTKAGGRVELEIDADKDMALIRVRDNGIGIDKEDQARIFERFYTVDKSRSKDKKSTGLGLSIVKHIVEYHQGTIEVESEKDKGTEILVKIEKDI